MIPTPYAMGWTPHSPVPETFRKATWKQMADGLVKDTVKKYLTEFPTYAESGMAPVFLGPARTWKTYGSAVMARWVHEVAHCGVQWLGVPDSDLNLKYGKFGDIREQVDGWKRIQLLVVDDFTACKLESQTMSVLTSIIAARFDSRLPTIWTGNLSIDGDPETVLGARYGAMFGRRLVERATGLLVILG